MKGKIGKQFRRLMLSTITLNYKIKEQQKCARVHYLYRFHSITSIFFFFQYFSFFLSSPIAQFSYHERVKVQPDKYVREWEDENLGQNIYKIIHFRYQSHDYENLYITLY